MRHKLIVEFVVIVVAMVAAPQTSSARAQQTPRGAQDYSEREVITQTFQLSPDARVEVSGVAGGAVDIETTDGGAAEVHIVRSARTRIELDCYRTVVEHTPSSLTVRHEQNDERGACRSIRARQSVRLRVPRTANLHLKSIGGEVNVEAIEGMLQLDGIAGHVRLRQAQAAEIAGLAKGLTMTVMRLDERGIRISGVVGRVELSLAKNLNADLTVSNLIGVESEAPGVTMTKVDASSSRTQIGAGGAPISISGVVGSVAINRSTN